MTNSFHKSERLCRLYLIDKLFEPGHSSSMVAFPLRMVYRFTAEPTQMLISVPKRQFKHAVDRNRVKRQIREAYRTHKHLMKTSAHIAFIWLDDKHHPSAEVTAKVCNLLTRLSEKAKL